MKCSKKKKTNETAPQENVKVSNTEVEFLKSGKSNNNYRTKRPTFKLEKEEEARLWDIGDHNGGCTKFCSACYCHYND